jgi:N-acyl homoserine lactone hydrolase
VLEAVPESIARFGVGHCSSMIDLPIYCYLVRPCHGGPLVLFDLGCAAPEIAAERGHRAVGTHHQSAADALRARAIDPDEIDVVVMSHLHWDHSHGLGDFPRAEVLIQRRELQYAFAPHPEQWNAYESWELGLTPDWMHHRERIRPLDGAATLGPGITIVPLPGHTPGSQGLVVDCGDRTYCCCGDHIVTYANLDVSPQRGRTGAPVPPGVHTDLIQWRESMSRIVEAGWIPLPAHEPSVEAVLAGDVAPPASRRHGYLPTSNDAVDLDRSVQE